MIKYLRSLGLDITNDEIAKELGVSPRTVKSLVSTLQAKGIIERQNGKRYARWVIIC